MGSNRFLIEALVTNFTITSLKPNSRYAVLLTEIDKAGRETSSNIDVNTTASGN